MSANVQLSLDELVVLDTVTQPAERKPARPVTVSKESKGKELAKLRAEGARALAAQQNMQRCSLRIQLRGKTLCDVIQLWREANG